MAFYRDKLSKTAESVLEGERFVAAVKCFPIGHAKRKMRNSALFGAVGALHTQSGTKDGHAVAGQELPLELAIGLTPTRVFVFGLSAMTGKATLPPLRVLPRDQVVGITSQAGRTLHMKQTLIGVRMADGSELGLETAQRHWKEGEELVEELRMAGVPSITMPAAEELAPTESLESSVDEQLTGRPDIAGEESAPADT